MKYSCYVLTVQFLCNLLVVCNLTLLGYDRVLEKRFWGPGKVLELFVCKRAGTLTICEDVRLRDRTAVVTMLEFSGVW